MRSLEPRAAPRRPAPPTPLASSGQQPYRHRRSHVTLLAALEARLCCVLQGLPRRLAAAAAAAAAATPSPAAS